VILDAGVLMKVLISALLLALLASCSRTETTTTKTTTVTETTDTIATAPPSSMDTSTTSTATLATDTSTTTTGSAVTTTVATPATRTFRLMPVDEGSNDASFVAYRESLLGAVRKRDRTALLALVDPVIRTSFGGDGGQGDLAKQWKLDQKNSPIWSELEWILTHGGSFTAGAPDPTFWAPYVYSKWPDGEDAFSFVAVTDSNVPLLESASAGSKTITQLDHDIVRLVNRPDDASAPWQVQTNDGKQGYVDARFIRSPIGYRAGFVKKNGAWKMNALVAGD
jgi:hypothetical protein